MEVLSCSGVQYVGESDCPQQSSGTTFIFDGESDCVERGQQVQLADDKMDKLVLNAEGCQKEKQGEGERRVNELPADGHCGGALYFDYAVEDQKQPCNSLYFEDDNLNLQNGCTEPCLASDSSHLIVDTIESEVLSNIGEEGLSVSEPKWLEQDEAVPLWVKWRGKWQAGIRCSRADWPLSTLKAKPTHDRKKYVVIFFPHTRNYSWADVLLVRPINEFPQSIAHKTHYIGLEMVKDLTIARRFIMQKLAVGMLHISDQLHFEALTENFRNVTCWKEFAMEASRCKGYSDLGRMLPRLQSMILMNYISPDWVQHSFRSWLERCQSADSAESVEILKEELIGSIFWNEIKSLWDAPVQPELDSEWKTWKHEAMKWFSMSHPISSGGDMKQQNSDNPLNSSLQINRKRPKLEVRRAETHASVTETGGLHQAATVDIDAGFFDSRDIVHDAPSSSEPYKEEVFGKGAVTTNSPGGAADRWNEIMVESGNAESFQTKDVEMTPMSEVVAKKSLDSGNKNRQCIAFIEAKGRQCVRWANDGDVYCCVHLASRFVGNSAKADVAPPVDMPMCEGTTTLGTRCKHRSLYGSSFCKKHRPQGDTRKTLTSPENKLKRKHEEIVSISESTQCKDIILAGEVDNPLQVDPISVVKGDNFERRHSLIDNPECSKGYMSTEVLHCIGSQPEDGGDPCLESPKRHSLYCDKHLPSWLKRARNGKSRIISKEVFIDLLRNCCSQEQKLHLHQACELFYRLFKSILSLRNPVPREVQFQWALSEASKESGVGESLTKLVCSEKDKLMRLWGFNTDTDEQVSSFVVEKAVPVPEAIVSGCDTAKIIKCKICSEEFPDDQALGTHWMDNHKKESQRLFRGYACAICLDSFTNRKVLESHVQDRHHVQFVEQCMLFQCIPCGSHFGNTEELWLHVVSVHPVDFRLSDVTQQHNVSAVEDSLQILEFGNSVSVENHTVGQGGFRKFICRFCGLKFDLLPDLGRHHQAAHMGPNLVSSRPGKKGIRYYAYRLKSGRLSRPRFKKGLGAASFKIRNRSAANIKKRIQASTSTSSGVLREPSHVTSSGVLREPSHVTEPVSLGRLVESQCSDVANILFSEIQKTRPRPSNLDILCIARSTCCKVNLQALLEEKYGVLPERLYLKAAKLCSEHNIQVSWHQDGFVCPNGCKPVSNVHFPSLLMPHSNGTIGHGSASIDPVSGEWEMDECHYVIDSRHFGNTFLQKDVVVCDDISFGQESVPITCLVDEDLLDSLHILGDGSDGQATRCSMPWESFTYVTKPLLDQSLGLDTESWQLGCACLHSTCSPERCDHVYLFDNDYSDAKDIYGKPMSGRFPFNEKGRIILEEGYLVYECNSKCSCNSTCQNRVLQNGVQVKLEVFRTEEKGWAVRAGEAILRGTFICEYIGEVLSEQEADKRGNRHGEEGCSYFFDIDSYINDMSRLVEGQVSYVIDATRYGNVSRFINHSCSPNLINHQVLVESMDCQLAHIGLFANRDIALGEELTYDCRYKLLPGEGYPCHCGASKCRGRLH